MKTNLQRFITEFFNNIKIIPRIYTLTEIKNTIGEYLEKIGFESLLINCIADFNEKELKTTIYKKAGYEEICNIDSGNYWLENKSQP